MVFLAPLAGITDRAFREVCAEEGAGLTFTEMVSAKGIKYNNQKTFELIDIGPTERTAGVQLFGREPETIAQMAAQLEQSMGEKIALFDVNMGCPAPKIVNNGEGSALMKEPETAARIISELKKSVSLPVTAKFRKGFDENSVNAVEFAKRLEDAGADGITVHGRTRQQYYEGKADWDIIARVKQSVKIPVIANGDIFTPENAREILQYTKADGIMIARGALGDPQIFRRVRQYLETGSYEPTSAEERLESAIIQAREACRLKGEHAAIRELRKHACWYLKGIRGGAAYRQRAVKVETLEEYAGLMQEVIEAIEDNGKNRFEQRGD